MRFHFRPLRHMLQTGGFIAMGIVLFLAAPAAQALQLRLEPDQSKLISLAGQPATVVVGNPVYADVTVMDKKILVQGRSFGKTSIIVLDTNGKQIASLDVTVSNMSANRLTVYKSGKRTSYLCLPDCERTLNVGDDSKSSAILAAEIRQKLDLAKSASQVSQ
jgi:Flp pilus assembly secretin CpaC